VKTQNKSRVRWADLIRSVVYQTLPYFGIACLWVGAWSRSLEARVSRDLEPHDNSPIYPTRTAAQIVRLHAEKPVITSAVDPG
jgi:hypothetical protein